MPDIHIIGLETLLELNGESYRLEKGYWVKFEAYRVLPTKHIPHGISYSITLHDRGNRRIVGFDNAHGYSHPRRNKYSGKKVTWDHKHNMEVVTQYEFESAAQLIEDFWNEVDKIV